MLHFRQNQSIALQMKPQTLALTQSSLELAGISGYRGAVKYSLAINAVNGTKQRTIWTALGHQQAMAHLVIKSSLRLPTIFRLAPPSRLSLCFAVQPLLLHTIRQDSSHLLPDVFNKVGPQYPVHPQEPFPVFKDGGRFKMVNGIADRSYLQAQSLRRPYIILLTSKRSKKVAGGVLSTSAQRLKRR
ncbi:hypothetical protein FRB93_011249 [Tulasnella sp. JGI-2019a]|nr:hypothetical protein FRB93_011249 [Tulasnella sp. JGI-2019a]